MSTLYKTDHDMEFHLPEYSGNSHYIIDKHLHRTLAKIDYNGILTVYKGYRWKGYTLLGYSLFSENMKYPLLVYSVLCKMLLGENDLKFYTRKDIDVIFRNIMKDYKVSYLKRVFIYYNVRLYSKVIRYL